MPRVRRTKSPNDFIRQWQRMDSQLDVANNPRDAARFDRMREIGERYTRNMMRVSNGDTNMDRQYTRNQYMGISRGSVAK